MSYVCPKDYKPCCDDLCHGGGCLRMGGYEMLAVCDVCKGIIDEEIPECGTCTCGDDYPDFCDDEHVALPDGDTQRQNTGDTGSDSLRQT